MRWNNRTRQWVAALRSGKYPQAQSTMRALASDTEYAYCCLGLEHAVCGTNDLWTHFDTGQWAIKNYTSHLPADEMEALGLTAADCGDLAELNDNNWTFEQIADVIEHCAKDGTISIEDAHYEWTAICQWAPVHVSNEPSPAWTPVDEPF